MNTKTTTENLKNAGNETIDKVTDKTQQTLAEGAKYAHQTLNKVSKEVENLQEVTKKYKETTLDYVQKNPLKALGLSAAVGAVLALLLKR